MVMKKSAQTVVTVCPDCGENITLKASLSVGQRVTCPNCEAMLEVVETEPLELDWYYEEEEESKDDEDW